MPHPSPYRVELRQPKRTRFLGILLHAKPHHRSLDPFVSRMLHEGTGGWLVLVNDLTGEVVARRRVAHPMPGP